MFYKLIQNIVNYEETLFEIYKAILLLNSMPDNYKEVKNVIKYGRDILASEIVIDSFRCKWMKIKVEKHDKKDGETRMINDRT